MSELRNYTELNTMSFKAAQYIERYISTVLHEKSVFSMVLSGGCIIQSLYKALFYIDSIPWEKIHFFITDEKCLPQNDKNSNLKDVVHSLLKRTNIPLQNIHWINTGIIPLKKSVAEYEKTLKHFLSQNGNNFDLLLLTPGPDGHIASLFPGFPALQEKEKLVVLTEKSLLDPRVQRITMTLPALNKTNKVLYFVSDENSRPVLNEIMYRKKDDKFSFPVEQINSLEMEHIWFILRS